MNSTEADDVGTLDRALALHVVQRMGETGQPPERGALLANVGTSHFLDALRDEYLIPMREHGRNSSFKLVQAPFGGGKTHFLHCLREIAWQHGFATSLVGLSPDECPLDDPVAIYRAVARQLELPADDPSELPTPGIEIVLSSVVEAKLARHGKQVVTEWLLGELARARIDSSAVRRAAEAFMQAVLDRDFATQELMAAFLRGEKVGASELAPHRIRQTLDSGNAFVFLRSLAQLLRVLDVPGLVMLFDEMDRVISLSQKRRRAIGDNLRQMLDHCGQSTLPSVLWVYAVPPEFMTTIVPEYPALEQRLRGAANFAIDNPLAPIIDLDRLPVGTVDFFESIGRRLLEIYAVAHARAFDVSLQHGNIALLARELGASQLESGARRTFVKAAVQMFDGQRLGGERPLGAEDLRGLARGNRGVLQVGAMEDEEDIF